MPWSGLRMPAPRRQLAAKPELVGGCYTCMLTASATEASPSNGAELKLHHSTQSVHSSVNRAHSVSLTCLQRQRSLLTCIRNVLTAISQSETLVKQSAELRTLDYDQRTQKNALSSPVLLLFEMTSAAHAEATKLAWQERSNRATQCTRKSTEKKVNADALSIQTQCGKSLTCVETSKGIGLSASMNFQQARIRSGLVCKDTHTSITVFVFHLKLQSR